ncbi:MAG: hypothetical protein K5679_12865 [Lachnospiraceae bacterium]|nr:hypothetical protein [Lachnospiraceae bacterium]
MKLISKVCSIVMSLAIVINCAIPSHASQRITQSDLESKYGSYISEEIVKTDSVSAFEIYHSLSPEARALFDSIILSNKELSEYHLKNVGSLPSLATSKITTQANLTNTLNNLLRQLQLLGLPTAVLYSLESFASSLVAAIADGPLPIGDILALAAAAAVVTTVAIYWDDVYEQWGNIVNAFTSAFPSMRSVITSAFSSLNTDVNTNYQSNHPLQVSAKLIIYNGVKYNCYTDVRSLSVSKLNQNAYYIAVIYNGTIFIDIQRPVDVSIAKGIMLLNKWNVGCLSTQTRARGLCGGNAAIWHNVHDSQDGYFYHYHHPNFKNFHCWYIS